MACKIKDDERGEKERERKKVFFFTISYIRLVEAISKNFPMGPIIEGEIVLGRHTRHAENFHKRSTLVHPLWRTLRECNILYWEIFTFINAISTFNINSFLWPHVYGGRNKKLWWSCKIKVFIAMFSAKMAKYTRH